MKKPLELFELTLTVRKAVTNPDLIKKELVYESLATRTAFMVHDDKKDKVRYICFRETSGHWWDWCINLVYKKVRDHRGIARHGGFTACYLSIFKALNKAIKTSPYPIKFVGYSKGGAMAQIAYERMPELHKDKKFLIPTVFGSPRVYGFFSVPRLPDRMKDIQRFEYRGDMVTKVPFFFMRFRHTGERIPLGKLRIFPFPLWPLDHYPNNYADELKNF